LDQLNRTQHELKQGSEKLEDILRKLEKEQVKNDFCFNACTGTFTEEGIGYFHEVGVMMFI